MGLIFNKKTASGTIVNKKIASGYKFSNKSIKKMTHGLHGFLKSAGKHKLAEELIESKRDGVIERAETHDKIQDLVDEGYLTKHSGTKIARELGLTDKRFRRFKSASEHLHEVGGNKPAQEMAEQKTFEHHLPQQPAQAQTTDLQHGQSVGPSHSAKTKAETGPHTGTAAVKPPSAQSSNSSPAMSFKPMGSFENSLESSEEKDGDDRNAKNSHRSIYSVLRERENNKSNQV
jgi:hypothetical protein